MWISPVAIDKADLVSFRGSAYTDAVVAETTTPGSIAFGVVKSARENRAWNTGNPFVLYQETERIDTDCGFLLSPLGAGAKICRLS